MTDNMTSLRHGELADLMARIDATGKPYTIYAEVLERAALQQFADAMEHHAITKGALMPDTHAGYSLPVGGVVASTDQVFPAFVGYDIGCGMVALPMNGVDADGITSKSKEIFDNIYRDVPTGFGHNSRDVDWSSSLPCTNIIRNQIANGALAQIGSLGGGNHFIEIGSDDDGRVWIICHSGSRNLGHKVASHYMAVAANSDFAQEGCFGLDVNSDDGRHYIMDLNYALEFALANRREIVRRVAQVIGRKVGGKPEWDKLINRNHNHAELRNGEWIHRKGATHAENGMMGVIPGNMRDGSFIVRGKGNDNSMCSSSHGAGRVLSRSAAKEKLTMADFETTMKGITAKVETGTLDESPFAYKDIFAVMKAQTDLVDVVHHVRPIINIKGITEKKWAKKKG